MADVQTVFIAGATGYIGRRLCAELMRRGHTVIALARAGSTDKVPVGCRVIVGNALDADSYSSQVPPGCTFIHLVGVAHPSPAKARHFLSVDLASVYASLRAATHVGGASASRFAGLRCATHTCTRLIFFALRVPLS